MPLTFYAELLPNIRSISLLISLTSPADSYTRVTVDPGSPSATLHHDGDSSLLILPARANPGTHPLIIRLGFGERNLSCRLPLALSLTADLANHGNYAPWSAPELSLKPSVSFCCRACSAVTIPSNRINRWKDLPSGNWADMMDFWHCHKPHDNKKQVTGDESEKYSSFGKGFPIQQGTGLVDRGYFLFSSKDCEAVQVVDTQLKCSCDTILGTLESESDGLQMWKLSKWNLRLSVNGAETAYPLEFFLSSQFISYAEEGGVRRLLITNDDDAETRLKIWIFNTDIRYTHSHLTGPIRGLKVFWQTVKPEENVPTDSLKSTGFEGIELDTKAFDTLKKCLDDSNKELPGEMGKSGKWNVGALKRFEEAH